MSRGVRPEMTCRGSLPTSTIHGWVENTISLRPALPQRSSDEVQRDWFVGKWQPLARHFISQVGGEGPQL